MMIHKFAIQARAAQLPLAMVLALLLVLPVSSAVHVGGATGTFIPPGATSADIGLQVKNQANTITFLAINGDGSGQFGYNGGSTPVFQWAGGSNAQIGQVTSSATSGYLTFNDANGALTPRGYIGYGSSLTTGGAQTEFTLRAQGVLHLDAGGNTAIMNVRGTTAPTIQGYGPTAGAVVDMTPDTGTFTITYTGFAANPTPTAVWSRNGNQVVLFFPSGTATSNATTFTATGLPSAIQPTRTQWLAIPFDAIDDATVLISTSNVVVTAASGTVTFFLSGNASGWTASGTKGVVNGFSVAYLLN